MDLSNKNRIFGNETWWKKSRPCLSGTNVGGNQRTIIERALLVIPDYQEFHAGTIYNFFFNRVAPHRKFSSKMLEDFNSIVGEFFESDY